MKPTGKEPPLPGLLGRPHSLFDNSFVIEFLQPPPELDASVLFRATYKGGHEATKLGKQHPQSPPLHIHFTQFESFFVEEGALGTTTTYSSIDTIHTATGNYMQASSEPGPMKIDAVPARNVHGVTRIPPRTPHNFWPVSPDHSFWSTPEGQEYERSQPKGRSSNTVFLLWGHPRHTTVHSAGAKFPTSFPPDMDAAFFLALLGLVDAVHGQRLTMSPGLGATLMVMQTASESCLILLPKAWWLGSLRWRIPWTAQVMLESIRSIFDRRSPVQIVDDVIESQFVRRQ
ncbi:hypothetical protein TrVGV298_006663 [Trichoderma virens]|nr:hypothetical protein TrVGV298_006663 [Trichoderma virens]